ncbi:MAG: BolA family protein [Halorhodospira sp.]
MMQPEELERLIRSGVDEAQVQVCGDGRHFQALVISPAFAGRSRLQRHRQVYAALREHLDAEALHAFSLRALTPDEHNSEQQTG